MKLKYFIQVALLLAFCCTAFVSRARSYAPAHSHQRPTLSAKTYSRPVLPAGSYTTVNLLEGNQEITLQAHKTSISSQIAYLALRSFTAYVKCIHFFSEYNDQRYTLLSRDFLFPFHTFW